MTKLQEKKYIVLKPIRYKHPGESFRKLITPTDNMVITLDHLPDEDIELLIKTRIVAPATAKEINDFNDIVKAAEAKQEKEDKADAEALSKAKADALAKMKKQAAG